MPSFIYRARNKAGRRVKGELEVASLEMARVTLQRKGFTQIKVKPKPKDLLEGTFLEGKVKTRDMVIFSRQFSTMINAGVQILEALQVMCEQTENKKLRRKLNQIRNDVEGGSSLYEGMSKHRDVFDDLYVNMVNAGETGGVLDAVLERLSEYIEKADKLKSKVKGAMAYPIVIFVVAIAVVGVILTFVIPTFADMFEGFGAELPAVTQVVINLSDAVTSNILWIILGIILLFVGFILFYRWERGRQIVDQTMLFIPIFGPLLRKVAVARFSRMLGTMLSSGVPILYSLDVVSKTAGNRTVENGVQRARQSISEGQTIHEPLEETGVFPPMVVHMISIGETTGKLDSMLSKIADFYEDEVDTAVESITSLIEPIMITFLGVVVGGLVISMYLPIFKMAGTVL